MSASLAFAVPDFPSSRTQSPNARGRLPQACVPRIEQRLPRPAKQSQHRAPRQHKGYHHGRIRLSHWRGRLERDTTALSAVFLGEFAVWTAVSLARRG